MKVSYKYLTQHVNLEGIAPEAIAAKLTFAGAEVESIESSAQGTNLVIGKIISCEPHPDSNHLHILQVDEGPKHGVHQIVCGAPNARVGLKVIVARTGARLPQIEIKPSVIRGVESDGMCCSLLELGVDKKYLTEAQTAGIEELPEDAEIGNENVLDYLGYGDIAIDLSLLPNRPDLYSFENVAREVACLFETKAEFAPAKPLKEGKTSFVVGSATPNCKIFTGRVVRGVETFESPKWLKEVLTTAGIRPINNIVDIGNWVMLLTGQPLNMYDADKLPVQELIVRDDFEGSFLAMDGKEYPLQKGDLVVTSGGEPMCLAGIMTADACRVDENTKNIVVEAAHFAYASIRHTSNRIGLASDSSQRFCKGINPDQMRYVQQKTAEMLLELANAKSLEEVVEYDEFPHAKKVIETTFGYLNGRLGTTFSKETILSTFERDNFGCKVNGERIEVEIPSYRIDIDGQADLSEELIRIQGYENVHSVLPTTELSLTGLTEKQAKERTIRRFLLAQGLNQVITYTLISKAETTRFAYLDKKDPYVLKNPMTVEREAVRSNLLHSVLLAAQYNAAHQVKDAALFEVSDIDAQGYQGKMLAAVLAGNVKAQGGLNVRAYDFYDAKGYVEGIFQLLGLGPNRYQIQKWSLGGEEMHPGRSAEIRMGSKLLGYFGELHPNALKRYDLKNAVVIELDLAEILSMKASAPKAAIPPKYPSVSRDLAFVVSASTDYEEIRKTLAKSSSLLKGVEIFDVYSGAGIAEGKKSIALKLIFADEEKTLKDEEINDAVRKAIASIQAKFGAELRG
ncbi:MAG: phenylalanine--tRNA ligase subunit beta [Bacilli bacterium]|nr:phenylalanine--tRNA ligase subunit beta [Bacilli bacterium]